MITAARQDILRFLRDAVASAGKLATRRDAAAAPQTFVFGNTSADLDSIISSIVYSYFATTPSKQYIPIVNLPDVPSGAELRRLRPELMEALKLSLASDSNGIPGNSDENAEGKLLKESLLTTHDLRQLLQEGVKQEKKRLNVMLVDWNALPKLSQGNGIPGISDALGDAVELSIVGCIDHHVDEHFVPPLSELPGQDPRRIQTPVGSCTSLVVSEIRYKGLWPDASESPTHHEDRSFMTYEAQAAKLAMSSILIDTINMTEEHKLSEADIEEVVFLEDKIRQGAYVNESIHWNRDAFYDSIARAK
ncbi:Exopolyphosphatase, partial [Ascosphaera atra]